MRRTSLAILVIVAAAVLVVVGLVLGRSARWRSLNAGSAGPMQAAAPLPAAPARPPSSARADRPPLPAAPAPSPATIAAQSRRAAPVWTLDKAASRLSFKGVMNGAPFDGVFRTWDAQIAFDPKILANSRATITVDTASALTGQPIKDAALPNSEWLATAAYPQATLVTRSITALGGDRYLASAIIHIRGVAWRTTVPFTVSISHDAGRMQATLTLDRRIFGIGEGPFRSPAPVEPLVQVAMKLVAQRDR